MPIRQARGWAHIRGRITVLEGVEVSGLGLCAAYARHERMFATCGCTATCHDRFRTTETTSLIGRFAIVDDSGVAVVDTELLDLAAFERVALATTVIVLRAGDTVDAFGRIQPADAPDAADALPLVPATYRDRGHPVSLTPTSRRRLALAVVPGPD